jgi:hypothetical protein
LLTLEIYWGFSLKEHAMERASGNHEHISHIPFNSSLTASLIPLMYTFAIESNCRCLKHFPISSFRVLVMTIADRTYDLDDFLDKSAVELGNVIPTL